MQQLSEMEQRIEALEQLVRTLQAEVLALQKATNTATPSEPALRSRGMLDRPRPRS